MIRERFREELTENGLPQIDPREFNKKTGNTFAHLLTELYLTKIGFLHVHIRSEGKGFWGFRSAILDGLTRMRKEGIPCLLVLLKGRLQNDAQRGTSFVADGYIVEDWDWMKESQGFSQTADKGNYKIPEKMLREHGCELIPSIQDVAQRLSTRPERLIIKLKQQRPSE